MGNQEWGIGRAGAAFAASVRHVELRNRHDSTAPPLRFLTPDSPFPARDQRANGNRPNNNPPANINREISTAHFNVKR
ncbi:hypothetical protein XA1314C_32090 [Xanthomonas arboricola]|uniref:Uncharacterized protein n=1 Tax=Xanthomonas arboricola TaxID=56448 RepID=A0AAU9I125_9XANT|nr:hypothetical protein XA1314C_32090 [Xanthomonas arboricola]CAE6815576.1 hypothetical protein XA1314C_32090 [Xanthomonas arboricola]